MKSTTSRRHYSPEQKLAIVMESYQRDTTIEAVKRKYGIRGSQLSGWRKEFKERAHQVFTDKRNRKKLAASQGYEPGQSPDELKQIIGELTVQNEILKKVQGLLN
jgi:transposase